MANAAGGESPAACNGGVECDAQSRKWNFAAIVKINPPMVKFSMESSDINCKDIAIAKKLL